MNAMVQYWISLCIAFAFFFFIGFKFGQRKERVKRKLILNKLYGNLGGRFQGLSYYCDTDGNEMVELPQGEYLSKSKIIKSNDEGK